MMQTPKANTPTPTCWSPQAEIIPASHPRQAIVIGAGFGGLAAALRLRARGYEVTLLDKQDQLGGRASVHRRNGFVFDAGPTVITAPFLLEELFALFGRRMADYLDLRPLYPWYRIRFADGSTFNYGGSFAQTLDEIRKFEPRDVDGYRRLLDKTKRIFEVGFRRLGDQPFLSPASMMKIVPQMLALESHRSVYSLTSKYITNDKLRQVFSFQPLLVGGNPFNTTSIYSLIHYLEREWGVHFPMGGTGAIVNALGRLMQEVGVKTCLGQTVERIVVHNGRATGVQLSGGDIRHGDIVVANADAPFVYKHLIAPEHRRKWTDKRVDNMRYSMGLFVLYFGATRTYPDLAHHTILLGPRYKELLTDIFDRQQLAQDFSLYLHAPTRTDPSMAPPGCESFYVLAPVPNLQAGIDWDTVGPVYRDRILTYLDSTVCPDLKSHVVEDFYVTPQHFRDHLLSLHGAGFSVQPTLTQSAYFRFHNQSEDVENLYFVGAGTHPGAGLPGVLCSAKVLDNILDPAGAR